jgi:hypothetical protein
MDPMQREIEEKNRKDTLRLHLARLMRIEIKENDGKPLSITAIINRAQKKGLALGDAAFPSRDEARPLLAELFRETYLFEDGWRLSLVARHAQLKEFRLLPPGGEGVPG